MKFINDGINPIIYEAIKKYEAEYAGHKEEKFASVTEIIAPFLQTILLWRYDEQLEVPASRTLWRLIGQVMHSIINKATEDMPKESGDIRLKADFDGYIITGGSDNITRDKDLITDFKLTSVWTYAKQSRVEEYTQQLSCYKLLWKLDKGIEIKRGRIEYLFKDWSPTQAWKDKNYPTRQQIGQDIPLWDDKWTAQWIRDRIQGLANLKDAPLNAIPKCEDTWGGKRCKHYCDVASFCPYYGGRRNDGILR